MMELNQRAAPTGLRSTKTASRRRIVMMNRKVLALALMLAVVALSSCGALATPALTEGAATYDDAFAYCAAVGTADAPGAEYTGPQVPDLVIKGIQTALDVPDTPLDYLENGTSWRCMDGHVYACFVGANLPCGAKAQTDEAPSEGAVEFCDQNPDADVVPAVATGRETVYTWRCSGGEPEVVEQVFHPDAQGHIAEIWYKIASQ